MPLFNGRSSLALVVNVKPQFIATAGKTNGSSVAEMSAFGPGEGSLTLPAGFWVPGKSIVLEGDIQFSTTMVIPTLTVRVKLGGTTLASTTIGNLLGSASNSPGHFRATISCRSIGVPGTLAISGEMNYAISSSSRGFADLNSVVTIDTTVSANLDVTTQWGTGSSQNVLTVVNSCVRAS